MNIGIFCGATGYGGSQNTTISLADELQRRGHQVILYVDRRRFRAHKDISSFEVCDLPANLFCQPILGIMSMRNIIRCISYLRQQQLDVALSISVGPLPLLLLCNAFVSFPIVYYEVGPKMRYTARVFRGAVVANSEETRDLLCDWLGEDTKCISVVRARVNVRDFFYAPSPNEAGQSRDVVILMMSRLELEKTSAIIRVMRAIELLVQQGMNVRLKICGSGRDKKAVISIAKNINEGVGKPVIQTVPANSQVGEMIRESDIAMGVGRCAWEAMACGRPVVVIGQEGIGGVVCEENLSTLMYCNFTARGSGKEEGPCEIAKMLRPLIESPSYRKQLGKYGLGVVKQHYDAAIGAEQMEAIFAKMCQATLKKTLLRRLYDVGVIVALWICLYAKGVLVWLLRPRVAAKSLRKAILLAKDAS